jgi:hypothetical protein
MVIIRLASDLVTDFESGRRNIKAETFMKLAGVPEAGVGRECMGPGTAGPHERSRWFGWPRVASGG